MFCFKCGKEIGSDTSFCPFCGQKQDAAPAETPQSTAFQRAEPATIRIAHKGKQRALVEKGYYIYVDGTKYYTGDFPNGITVKVAPGTHHVYASVSVVTNDQVRNFGKASSKVGDAMGGWFSIGADIVNLSTHLSTKIVGERGTCSYHVDVKSGETVTLETVLKPGFAFSKITIEEIERN